MVYTRKLFPMTLRARAGKMEEHADFTVYRVLQNDVQEYLAYSFPKYVNPIFDSGAPLLLIFSFLFLLNDLCENLSKVFLKLTIPLSSRQQLSKDPIVISSAHESHNGSIGYLSIIPQIVMSHTLNASLYVLAITLHLLPIYIFSV